MKPTNILLTTTDLIDGKTIKEYAGIVFGNRSGADLALDDLISAAENLGTDAVVGIRFETESGWVLAYGTAVKFK